MTFECPGCGQYLVEHVGSSGEPKRSGVTCKRCGREMVPLDKEEQNSSSPTAMSGFDPEAAPVSGVGHRTVRIDLTQTTQTIEPSITPDPMTISKFLDNHDMKGGVSLDAAAIPSVSRIRGNEKGGKYELGEVLAEGGMGTIMDAWDQNLRRHIAMKLLVNPKGGHKDRVLRFIEEAQVTSQLEHPSVVPVHELAVDASGNVFYTMKLLKGKTLGDILKGIREGNREIVEAYSLSHLLTIYQKICDAMAFAHSKRVIHRDLKPDNVMVGEYGEVQVMDWGLAKVLARKGEESGDKGTGKGIEPAGVSLPPTPDSRPLSAIDSVRDDEGADIPKTMDGSIMGTPGYMAPEQAKGDLKHLDERADIYSLGAILYAILTLRPPIKGKDLAEFLSKVASGEIRKPTEYGRKTGRQRTDDGGQKKDDGELRHLPDGVVPESLSAVALKALALRPEDRYGAVTELQRDIEAYQDGFATGAEEAGVWRQLGLFVRRNQGVSLATGVAVLVLILVVAGAWRINVGMEREKAEQERAAAAAKREALQARTDKAEQERAAEIARREALEQQLAANAVAARLKAEENKREETWIPVYDFDFATQTNLGERFETVFRSAKDLLNTGMRPEPAPKMARIENGCLNLGESTGLVSVRWKGQEDVGDDVQLECEIDGSNNIGVAVGGDSFNGYRAVYDARLNTVILDTIMAPFWKSLASSRQPLKPSGERRQLRVEKSGSTIRVWVDDDLVIDYFDPLILSGQGHRTFALSAFYTKSTVYSLHFRRRRSPEVVSCLESAREFMRRRRPDDPNDHRLADANDFLRAQIQMHGDSEIGTEAKLLLSICLQYQRKTDQALQMLQSVVKFEPRPSLSDGFPRLRAAAFQQISLIHFTANRFQDAAQAAREACLLDSGSFAAEQIHQALVSNLRRPGVSQGEQAEVLRALGRLPLSTLVLPNMDITDLSSLKGMPLTVLNVGSMPVVDLTPLEGMSLTQLDFNPSKVTKGLEVIRNMSSLETINGMSAGEFWKKWDERKK